MLRTEERAFVPGVAWARAGGQIRAKESLLARVRAWVRGDSPSCRDSWRRVAEMEIGGASSLLHCKPGDCFHFVKLTSASVELDVRRLTLEFSDGSLQDLSVGLLVHGCESRPMSIGGRELKGIVLEYKARPGTRGSVEVWAHN